MVLRSVLAAAIGLCSASVAFAGSMTADEAKRFTANKMFSFTCFDGTRGAGRVFDDGGAAGAVQFSGGGVTRHMRLPGNTLQVRGQSICASIKGMPFEPCFNLVKNDERSFRGSVSGMGFAYCDFQHQGASQMLMARAGHRMRGPRSLKPQSVLDAEAPRTNVAARIETPRVDTAKIEPVKIEPVKPAMVEADLGLRKTSE